MAGTTPKGLPYPTVGDAPNVATDIQALATAVDTELNDYLTTTSAASTYATITSAATQDDIRSISFMLGGM
jgi:hypothetical protein